MGDSQSESTKPVHAWATSVTRESEATQMNKNILDPGATSTTAADLFADVLDLGGSEC